MKLRRTIPADGLLRKTIIAYFDLLSYLYLSRLIHNASLIILLTICTTRPLLPLASSHTAHANIYWTSPLSRYLAVHYLTPQRVLSHIPSYSIGYSHAYITHPGRLIQSHTLWHILHTLTHTLLRIVISLAYDSLHY
jgi:hypothetical protein